MTDQTTTPGIEDAIFDTSTAAGRLRILWGATADPQLAMSDDEVADVATVLAEHAAIAAELEQLRSVQATLVDGGTYTASQLNRIAGIVRHADMLHHVVELEPGEVPPTLDSVIQAITQILVEDEPVKNAWIIVWRELIGGMTLRSEQQLREMAERDRDEARAELERVGEMTAAEVLAWRAER